MNLGLRKIFAYLSVCLTALGIILSVFLLFQVWKFRQPVTDKLQSSVDQVSILVQTTEDGLSVIDQAVKNVYTSTIYLGDATNALSQTMSSTSQFIDTAGIFVGDNLLTTITNTQIALGSAQASAKVIDNILGAMSRIPLIGINYNPTTPLNVALGEVSTSLDPLQTTLKSFKTDLDNTRSNMGLFSGQISYLDQNINAIKQNLRNAQVTIDDYHAQIISLKTWVGNVKTNMPGWITTLAWIITLVIVWLIIIQGTILLQAATTLASNRMDQDISGKTV